MNIRFGSPPPPPSNHLHHLRPPKVDLNTKEGRLAYRIYAVSSGLQRDGAPKDEADLAAQIVAARGLLRTPSPDPDSSKR